MSLPASHSRTDAGFTLVEVLVAIALLATVAAMVFSSLLTTTRLVEAGRDRSAQEQTVRRVLRVMADEISLSKYEKRFPWTGINGTVEGQPADTLAVLTMSDGTGSTTSETIRVVYTRDGDRLMRFAKKNLHGLTDESLDQLELADRVKGFNLRYFHGPSRMWIDDWPAAQNSPKALLIEVTFQQADEPPWTVREWVTIGASS
jgi:general secretion pathway protein J